MNISLFKPLVLVSVLAAFPVLAADRFYQVIGPDGRPQMVLSPEVDKAADSTPPSSAPAASAESAALADGQAPVTQPVPSAKKKGLLNFFRKAKEAPKEGAEKAEPTASGALPLSDAPSTPAAPPPGWAPYDSDSYLDSEALEKSEFNPEQKKRFYLLNDGTRMRAEEELSETSEPLFTPQTESSAPARAFIELPDEFQTGDWKNESGYPEGQNCLGEDVLKKTKPLFESQLSGVILDKKALTFVKPGQVLESFELANHDGAWLIVRSYATTARKPSYARPVIVLADRKGCVQRTLTGYFRWHYAATKTRYSELEGEIKLAPHEVLVFVVVPKNQPDINGEAYRLSRTGKLGIKWVR